MSNPQVFCAYIHVRPNGMPFYVGKGAAKRARCMKRNQHHDRVVAKYGAENIDVGVMECSAEAIAFDLEVGMIKCFRRMGIELTNKTNGGEGFTGGRHTVESKAKISAASTGQIISAGQRAKISAKLMGHSHSAETRAKISAAQKGKKRAPRTAEHNAKMSAALKGKKFTAERCAAISVRQMGREVTLATRAKASAFHAGKQWSLGRKRSAETIAKTVATQAANRAAKSRNGDING